MCISSEEQDSIRALAAATTETAKLARTLYAAVLNDPDAKSRSKGKLRVIRLSPFPSEMSVPMVRKANG
jgi:hypothetical protein